MSGREPTEAELEALAERVAAEWRRSRDSSLGTRLHIGAGSTMGDRAGSALGDGAEIQREYRREALCVCGRPATTKSYRGFGAKSLCRECIDWMRDPSAHACPGALPGSASERVHREAERRERAWIAGEADNGPSCAECGAPVSRVAAEGLCMTCQALAHGRDGTCRRCGHVGRGVVEDGSKCILCSSELGEATRAALKRYGKLGRD